MPGLVQDDEDSSEDEDDEAPEVDHHLTPDPQFKRALSTLGKAKKTALLTAALSHWDFINGALVRPTSATTTSRIKSTIAKLADEYEVLTVNFNVPTAHGGRPLLYSTKSRLSTCRKYAKLPPFSLLLFFFFFPPLFFFFFHSKSGNLATLSA